MCVANHGFCAQHAPPREAQALNPTPGTNERECARILPKDKAKRTHKKKAREKKHHHTDRCQQDKGGPQPKTGLARLMGFPKKLTRSLADLLRVEEVDAQNGVEGERHRS